jgi:hypothetical protein
MLAVPRWSTDVNGSRPAATIVGLSRQAVFHGRTRGGPKAAGTHLGRQPTGPCSRAQRQRDSHARWRVPGDGRSVYRPHAERRSSPDGALGLRAPQGTCFLATSRP